MFDFKEIRNNKEDAIKMVSKLIVDEINYINKLCFFYSTVKEKNPGIFEENAIVLLRQLERLSVLKRQFDNDAKGVLGEEFDEKVLSLSHINASLKKVIVDNVDDMIDYIVQENELIDILTDDVYEDLMEIDNGVFDSFITEMKDIHQEVRDYVTRSVKYANKNLKLKGQAR